MTSGKKWNMKITRTTYKVFVRGSVIRFMLVRVHGIYAREKVRVVKGRRT